MLNIYLKQFAFSSFFFVAFAFMHFGVMGDQKKIADHKTLQKTHKQKMVKEAFAINKKNSAKKVTKFSISL
jgi:hypothetical protein